MCSVFKIKRHCDCVCGSRRSLNSHIATAQTLVPKILHIFHKAQVQFPKPCPAAFNSQQREKVETRSLMQTVYDRATKKYCLDSILFDVQGILFGKNCYFCSRLFSVLDRATVHLYMLANLTAESVFGNKTDICDSKDTFIFSCSGITCLFFHWVQETNSVCFTSLVSHLFSVQLSLKHNRLLC